MTFAAPQRAFRPLTDVAQAATGDIGRFDFAVTGDCRPTLPQYPFARVTKTIFSEIRLIRPALVLFTGDIVWGYGGSRQEMLNDLDRFKAMANSTGVPVYNVPGNHEMQTDRDAIDTLLAQGHDLYGSFDVGGCHFIALNTDDFWLEGRVTGEQLDWLRADLEANRSADHIFVFLHRPLFSWFQGDFNPDDAKVLSELFRKHHVRATFSAHDHFHYVEEHDGVRYMTVGGAGAPLYAPPDRGGFAHYVLVSVTPDDVTYTVVEPGHLVVEHVAGNDGIEPVTVARVANTSDSDRVIRNLELRVPRLASEDGYRLAVDYRDWERTPTDLPVVLRSVRDLDDGSVMLSVEVPVPTGTAFRVSAEARL